LGHIPVHNEPDVPQESVGLPRSAVVTDADETKPKPWWGTGAAATQCEGAAPRADWAGWEAEGRVPASSDGNGFRTRYADDLALWAEHGLRHHRLTIEWARLEPYEGQWDQTAADHVASVLRAARDVGIEVWACLLHGSAPGWFTDDQRGWLDDKAAGLTWPRHVDRVAEQLGDLVAGWVPIHEPDLQARLGYLDGTFPPGRHTDEDHHDALAALRQAEDEAARLLRGGGQPVAVSARPGDEREHDDLVVVSAPVTEVERALERAAGAPALAGAELLVVTGDPDDQADPNQRAARLRQARVAVEEGAQGDLGVRGAFVLPAVDGYEWHRGFDAELGLFDRDRNPRPTVAELRP
jgi:beta-glucosidase/6-phospho-beta-glucosidase/beta-galactosidase